MYKFKRIRELRNDGKNYSEIAKELKIDRKTVSKYLKNNCPPSYKKRESSTRDDPVIPYMDRLESLLEIEDIMASDIYEILVEEGYKGSERTIRRRIADKKSKRSKERFFEQEYIPGEQSQFDFKERINIPFTDGDKSIYFHFGTLPFSNHFMIRAYPRNNLECFMDGVHEFFSKLGGMTKNIRIDNLAPCVSKVHKGSRRTYTDNFQKAIDYYGFEVSPCRPGKGNDKGDVERDIRTHAGKIKKLMNIKNIKFKSFSDLNNWLYEYCINRTTELIKERREKEIKKLKVLPKKDESILYRIEEHRASSYGAVKIGDYYYSVPDCSIGQRCKTVATPYEVRIYNNTGSKELLARHDRYGGDGILLEHILPSLVRKPSAMIRWKNKNILFPSNIFKKYYNALKRQEKGSAEVTYLKTINLIQHTNLDEIECGMDLVLNSNEQNMYESVKDLILGERRPNGNYLGIENQSPINVNLNLFDKLLQ